MIRVRAPAKLNVGLEILERRADGYHEIQTLFVPLRLFDEIEVEAADSAAIALDPQAEGRWPRYQQAYESQGHLDRRNVCI